MTPNDFWMGFALMNAMPHFLFGLLKIRFFSLLGFSPVGNIAYGFVNIGIAATLFHNTYGINQLPMHGMFIGSCAMLLIYLILGRFFYNRFQLPGGAVGKDH